MKVQQSLFLVSVGVALAMACGGTTVNPPDLGDGGGSSGGSGSSSGAGGSCTICTVDQDCVRACGPTSTPNYNWCCGAGTCYTFSTACPPSSSSSGGSGSSGGSTSSGSGSSGSGSSSGGLGGSGATPGTGPIACGMAGMCMPPNVCCAGGGANGGDTCTSAAMCVLAMGDVYSCTGAANCPGGVCCVTPGNNGAPDVAACRSTCAGGGGRRQVCQSSAECMNGQRCRMGNVALNVCQ